MGSAMELESAAREPLDDGIERLRHTPDEVRALARRLPCTRERRNQLCHLLSSNDYDPGWKPGFGPLRIRSDLTIRAAAPGLATILRLDGSPFEIQDTVIHIHGPITVNLEGLCIGSPTTLCDPVYVAGCECAVCEAAHEAHCLQHGNCKPYAGPLLRMTRCSTYGTLWLGGRGEFRSTSTNGRDIEPLDGDLGLGYVYNDEGEREEVVSSTYYEEYPYDTGHPHYRCRHHYGHCEVAADIRQSTWVNDADE